MVLGIYGAGATALELFEMIQQTEPERWEQIVFIDDTQIAGEFCNCFRFPFSDFIKEYSSDKAEIVIAIGEPSVRNSIYEKIVNNNYKMPQIIHPLAMVSPSAKLGQGVVVKMLSIISANAEIEDNVFIQSNTIVGHDVKIGKSSQISSFSQICGKCCMGEACFVGVNSSVRENLNIGQNAIISMGAIVLKDVPDYATVIGNPARVVSKKEDNKVFYRPIQGEK